MDGVVEARTAAMFEPYAAGGTGLLNWTPEDLTARSPSTTRRATRSSSTRSATAGIAMALSAYEARPGPTAPAAGATASSTSRSRGPRTCPRFKALGVIASTQALFAHPDQNHLGVYVPTLGPARAARAMPFKAIDDAGAVQAFGSDWPVFTCEVLRGIYCAATRTTPEGTPAGGWKPEQPHHRRGRAAPLHARRGLCGLRGADVKGTLAAGKLADFVVAVRRHPGRPPEGILKTRVLLTVLGGQDTFRAREF